MVSTPYEDHPLLPAGAPVGQAHILKTSASGAGTGHKLCDFIATLLHNLTDYPNAAKDFFNPEVTSFKLIRHYRVGESGRILPYIIWRKNKKVACGCIDVISCDPDERVEWNTFTMSTLLPKVAPDARWSTTWGVYEAFTRPPLGSLWSQYLRTRKDAKPFWSFNNAEDAEEAESIAYEFGRDIYRYENWKPHTRMEIKIEVER